MSVVFVVGVVIAKQYKKIGLKNGWFQFIQVAHPNYSIGGIEA